MAKKVFLSHSSRDVVLTRLIAHILEENGIKCFYSERDIHVGEEFDSRIIKDIHECDLLLVVWSSQAVLSPWVNQEVGIALAQRIPVWPIAVDEIAVQGAMFRKQGSNLTRHSDPHSEIIGLARAINASPTDHTFEPYVDQYILGKEERTRRLVELLRRENANRTPSYTLRVQAAFSSFAVSDSPEYRVGGYHTPEYHRLLVEELEEARQMAQWASLRVILWPQRPYEDSFMKIRFRNLVQFLTTNQDFDRIRFVIGRYHGGNRYILDRNVLVTGIKSPGANVPGYEITTVTFHGPTVASAIQSFDRRFEELWNDHAAACGVDPKDVRMVRSHVKQEVAGFSGH
ncbi:MAG TPA: toll/interleukin-1 receptor domain-containing protein [Candidatus Eisenbacteria bacterium]|nr:toll/interleukin-1 receptor domain-containing protein [Candidatus Eisenbacteria bacterium]